MPNVGTPAVNSVGVDRRGPVGIDRRRPAGQDDRGRAAGQHLLDRHGVRHDLAVDARLAHPAGDQLGILRPEVDDEHRRRSHARSRGDNPPGVRRMRVQVYGGAWKVALFAGLPGHSVNQRAPTPLRRPGEAKSPVAGALPALDGPPAVAAAASSARSMASPGWAPRPWCLPRSAEASTRASPTTTWAQRGSGRASCSASPSSRRWRACCGTGSRSDNWLYASFRSMQLLGRHSAEVGVAIRAQAADRRGGLGGHQRRADDRRRLRHLGAAVRRDRVLPDRRRAAADDQRADRHWSCWWACR